VGSGVERRALTVVKRTTVALKKVRNNPFSLAACRAILDSIWLEVSVAVSIVLLSVSKTGVMEADSPDSGKARFR
jgi:hypothetical protein